MGRKLLALSALLFSAVAYAQVTIPPLPQPVAPYAAEDKDWGVEAAPYPKRPPYHAPTPLSLPGGRTLRTLELKALLDADKDVVVVDVLGGKERETIPGAYWLPGAGNGEMSAADRARFADVLAKLSAGNRNRPLVFLCLSSECWLSYNAAVHAIDAGYTDVLWYRGGTDAWSAAGLPKKKAERLAW